MLVEIGMSVEIKMSVENKIEICRVKRIRLIWISNALQR